jgi:hypothetical protein
MSRSRMSEKTEMLVSSIQQATDLMINARRALLPVRDRPDEPPSQRTELRYTIVRLRRLLRDAMGDGNDQKLAHFLNDLAENGAEIEKAIVVWVDLIEILVQNAERRYGTRSGRGSIKTAEVKQVVRYFLRTGKLQINISGVPSYLMPVIIDIIVEWLIDALVRMSDQYSLWTTTEPAPQSIHAIILLIINRIYNFFRPLLERLGLLFNRIWFALREVPLSPATRSAIHAIERDGLLEKDGGKLVVQNAVNLFVWIGEHRDQVVAAVELVFAAVQEAESYLTMTGPEKKEFAHDLVLAVLDEIGFEERIGLTFAIVNSMINGAIEASVAIFHRRGVFESRSAA